MVLLLGWGLGHRPPGPPPPRRNPKCLVGVSVYGLHPPSGAALPFKGHPPSTGALFSPTIDAWVSPCHRYVIPAKAQVPLRAMDLLQRMLVVDQLKRITIPQIREHEWFLTALPAYLALPPEEQQTDEDIDNNILEYVCKKTNVPRDIAIKVWPPPVPPGRAWHNIARRSLRTASTAPTCVLGVWGPSHRTLLREGGRSQGLGGPNALRWATGVSQDFVLVCAYP